ncbi:MAG: hypothetical protein ACOC6U_00975 [Thermoplasmatota archaeon]
MSDEVNEEQIDHKSPKITGIMIALMTLISLGIIMGSIRFAYILMHIKVLGIPIEYFLLSSLILCWIVIIVIASKNPKKNCHIYRTEDGDKYIKK